MAGLDEAEVVDPGCRGGVRLRLRPRLRVDVAGDPLRQREAHRPALVAHLELAELEGIEEQLDLPVNEGGVDLVAVAVELDGGRLRDAAALGPEKGFAQLGRAGQRRRPLREEAGERRLARLRVRPLVVDALDPGGEEPVELGQVGQLPALELDQELAAHGAEEALDLAARGRLAGARVDEADAEHGGRAGELLRGKRRAVVDVEHLRQAARGQACAQRGLEPERVLGEAEAVAGQAARVVVDEAEQVAAASAEQGAVQGIAGPEVVRRCGAEAAVGAGRPRGRAVEPGPGEVALERALRGRAALALADDRRHLGGGAAWQLPLEGEGERE